MTRQNPNYTQLQTYADLDALMATRDWHIRAENPDDGCVLQGSPQVRPDDLSGTRYPLLGGIAWNKITRRLSEMARLPLRAGGLDPGNSSSRWEYSFVAQIEGQEWKSWAEVGGRRQEACSLRMSVGLPRVPNPLKLESHISLYVTGIHSRGVYGAVLGALPTSASAARTSGTSTRISGIPARL